MTDVRLKISPPWVTFVHKIQALFDEDPHIAVNVDYSVPEVTLAFESNEGEKAAAVAKLLPEEKVFGNITLKINIDCANIPNITFKSAKELFEKAFKGNPVFAYAVVPASEYWAVPFTYVVFKNCVVQFFNDNLNDPHGVISTLYQEIANDVFEQVNFAGTGVAYCTDIEKKLGMPLGEWP